MVSDENYGFKSETCENMSNSLLGELSNKKGRDNASCVAMINLVTNWCIEDENIARYIFE